MVLILVLEKEQVVGGCDSDHIFCRMPSCVQDFLVEVQTIYEDLVLLALATCAHLQENVNKRPLKRKQTNPDQLTFRGLRIVFGLAISLDAS